MERRVVLAVVLMIAVIFLTNLLFPPFVPPPGQMPADSADAGVVPEDDVAPPVGEQRVDRPPELPAEEPGPGVEAPAELEEPGDTIRVSSDLYSLRFSTRGAALIDAELLQYRSYARNGESRANARLVRTGDWIFGYRVAIGSDTVSLDRQAFDAERMEISLTDASPTDSAVFRYRFPSGSAEFVVIYRFRLNSYVVGVEGRLEGIEGRGYSVLSSLGHGLQTNEKNPQDDYSQLEYVVNGRSGGIRGVNLDKIGPGEVKAAEGGPFHWVAVKNKYFVIGFLAPPEGPLFGGLIAAGEPGEHSTALVASLPVPAGNPGFRFDAYLGPQEYDRLSAAGQELESVNPYGWRWLRPIIRPLVGLVMIVLTWMHGVLNLAYGWVLILFGVLMRVVLFPLYQKSMRAQLAQMQVQPLMKELQARHKDDPQKLQQEMLKLYREHNVNPLAGCLPMMLPMPILFTLFFVFQGTIEFRGVPFLWLPDLSLKDPLYIIPLLMGASMFALQWIGQRGMEVNPQMKMMGWLMPVVFTVLFMNFPSGLNLYYATSNVASLPQQVYLSRERQAARRASPTAKVDSEEPEPKQTQRAPRRPAGRKKASAHGGRKKRR